MKVKLGLLLTACLALFAALSFKPTLFKHSTRLKESMVAQDAWNAIVSVRTPSPAPLLDALFFNGFALINDAVENTFYYSLTDNDYDPEVTAQYNVQSAAFSFLEESVSAEKLRQNHEFRLIAYTDTQYCIYFLRMTTLPLLSLKTEGGGTIAQENMRAEFLLYDNSPASLSRVVRSKATVRTRGATSMLFPQKSYRLFLMEEDGSGNNQNLLGLRNDDDWILYAPYNDPEKMRQLLAWEFWNNIGAWNNSFSISNGVSGKFAELFINGSYEGLYVLMYPFDAKQARAKASDDPTKSDYIYRSWTYRFRREPLSWESFEAAAHTAFAENYELRFPQDRVDSPEKWRPLFDFLNVSENASDAELYKAAPTMMETGNIADFWLFVNAVCAVDNIGKNEHYVAKKTENGYTLLLAPWDLDQTWANFWDKNAPLLTTIQPEALSVELRVPLFDRLMELNIDHIQLSVYDRWLFLRSTRLSDAAVNAMLDGFEKDVYGSGALLRNEARWPEAYTAKSADALRGLVFQRLAYMDTLVKARRR